MYGFKRRTGFEKGWASLLPPEYHKFHAERTLPKKPVHYIPKTGKYERNELTGEVRPVQDIPLPLKFPDESHQGIWGGEGILQGYIRLFQ